MNRNIRQTVLPLLAALIWGLAFSAQSVASAYMGPFAFNAYRSAMACAFLLVLDQIAARLIPGRRHMFRLDRPTRKQLALAGLCCGGALFLAANMQQLAIGDSSAGKVGFITAMYIIGVPLLGLFRGKRPRLLLWVSVAVAALGMYFLCVTEGFSIVRSDFYALLCALFFSLHILVVDHFTSTVDGIQMSCFQFLVVTVLSGAGMLLFERPSLQALVICLGPILYAGILSSGVAYTLQILSQKDANPTVVSLLMSMESVFAAIGGAVLLHETMSGRELLGCALMLAAVVLAQLPAAKEPVRPGADAEKGHGPI